jgi:hypothetical protein
LKRDCRICAPQRFCQIESHPILSTNVTLSAHPSGVFLPTPTQAPLELWRLRRGVVLAWKFMAPAVTRHDPRDLEPSGVWTNLPEL